MDVFEKCLCINNNEVRRTIMQFKTYRIVDLLMLGILGTLIEAIGTYLASAFIPNYTPYCIIGMFIVLVAVTRWKWYGLILIPFMALGNFVAGHFFLPKTSLRGDYTWIRYLYTALSYLSVLICLKFYKKTKPISIYKKLGKNLTVISTITLLQWLILIVGNIIEVGLYVSSNVSVIAGIFLQILNVGFGLIVSYVLTIVCSYAFCSQNIMVNVKENLLERKKEAESEREYYSNLVKTIDEVETPKEESSSNRKDCDHDGT